MPSQAEQALSNYLARATVIKVESLENLDYTVLKLPSGHLVKVSSDHPIESL